MNRLLLLFMLWLLFITPAHAGEWVVTMDPKIRSEPASGRVILFFLTETGGRWDRELPMNAPFYEQPQPIASIGVQDFTPGESVTLDESAVSFPGPLSALSGVVRVQAVFDHDRTERGHAQGPGNLYSDVKTVDLDAERDGPVRLTLTNVIEPSSLPTESEHLKWVEFRSELLSEFYGRDVSHRAGVALPPAYVDEAQQDREWPAMYIVPGFGGRHTDAVHYGSMLRVQGAEEFLPMVVMIVLDPESPLGHHGFVDNDNHGLRGTALVTELIPYLESNYRLAAKPEARIIAGHSSGGWTSLWLQLNWPDVFGACWSSAPDPIDFSAFQKTNLYVDESVYVMPSGEETPSYREQIGYDDERVAMTVREEGMMEAAIHPHSGSGQQWDTWAAMFSPPDPETGFPKRMFDAQTGRIDREVVEHWKQFDMAHMIREDWQRFGPIVTERVRLACGELDCYYLHRAVHRFKAIVDENGGEAKVADTSGYIFLHEHATHSNIMRLMGPRWFREQREYLRLYGLHE